ncbi:MAG: glycerate kinase [Planctomycetota bacterium]|nr:MAG: glycerate kinase [Planctomycetota bacterium]
MKKIVIAPDSYKGTFTSVEAAKVMAMAVKEVFPNMQIDIKPMADGGAGTLEALSFSLPGEWISCQVHNPLGEPILASYYRLFSYSKEEKEKDEEAVLEMARTAGLLLIPEDQRNPFRASTFGTGEMILHCLERGFSHISLTLGGSGTNDGGVGMALALGYKFLDSRGNHLFQDYKDFYVPKLKDLHSISVEKVDSRIEQVSFQCITDVNNPFIGPQGASAVYGPQKGATPEMVGILDEALASLAKVVEKDLGVSIAHLSGAGAAGGLGGGVAAFLKGRILPGAPWMAEKIGLPQSVSQADLVITGEGKVDGQTLFGKTIYHIAKICEEYSKELLVLAGSLGEGYENLEKNLPHIHIIDLSKGKSYSLEELQKIGKDLIVNSLKEELIHRWKGEEL